MIKTHPRSISLKLRHLIEEGVAKGIVTPKGMIAHGRGEVFDYLLGEKTIPEAQKEIEAAASLLLLSKNPVISVNGNVTVLAAKEVVALSKACNAKIEANVFYRPVEKRKKLIAKEFREHNVRILGQNPDAKIPGLGGERKNVANKGIFQADVVLVMLEDGDRTEALRKFGKKVIAIDLNPLSRTAKKANIAIIDNVTRALPLLTKKVREFKQKDKKTLKNKLKKFKNKQ